MSTVIGHDGSVYEVVVDQLKETDEIGLDHEFKELMRDVSKNASYSEFGELAEQILRNDITDEICERHGWKYSRRYYYE